MAVHVTTPENSRIVKYSISNLGVLTIHSLAPKTTNVKLTTGAHLSDALIPTEYKGKDYQSMLASLFVQSSASDKSQYIVNINYINPPKTAPKPNRFEVESKRLLSFN